MMVYLPSIVKYLAKRRQAVGLPFAGCEGEAASGVGRPVQRAVCRQRSEQVTNHAERGLLSTLKKINGYALESLLSKIPTARPPRVPLPAHRRPPRPYPRRATTPRTRFHKLPPC